MVIAAAKKPTIPEHHPRIGHLEPYWFNDSLAGIAKAKRAGYRYMDQDGNVTAPDKDNTDGVLVIKHWKDRTKDGFVWIWTGKYIRGTKIEVRVRYGGPVNISILTWGIVSRLRQKKYGGSRYYRVQAHMNALRKRDMIMCLELKDNDCARPKVVQQVKSAQKITGCKVYIMTLSTLDEGKDGKAAATRLGAYKDAGFETALLPRGPKPKFWARDWAPHIDAVWGHWTD